MKKVFLLGQAPPRIPASRPFGRSALYTWLSATGISEEYITQQFYFTALIPTYPGSKNGSHLKPTPQQIADARPNLLVELKQFEPDILVPIGILAIREVLSQPLITLDSAVGKVFRLKPFNSYEKELPIIPLPHPSGASPWVHLGDHKLLLEQALRELKQQL